MELNWRWGAFAGIGAFVISLFFGLVAGVLFGTLLMRALVGGLVFAGVGVGCNVLISKLLPELFETTGNQPISAGGGIDIVVQDDISSDQTVNMVDDSPGEKRETRSMDVDNLVEEMEESTVTDVGSTEAVPVLKASESESSGALGVEDNVFDELPDLNQYSGSFVSERLPEQGVQKETALESAATEDKNPEVLARVVQTLLKRDQKG
jgi:hypothetical protein